MIISMRSTESVYGPWGSNKIFTPKSAAMRKGSDSFDYLTGAITPRRRRVKQERVGTETGYCETSSLKHPFEIVGVRIQTGDRCEAEAHTKIRTV